MAITRINVTTAKIANNVTAGKLANSIECYYGKDSTTNTKLMSLVLIQQVNWQMQINL